MGSIALPLILLLALAPRACLASRKRILSGSRRRDDGSRVVVSVLEPHSSFLGSYLPGAAVSDSHLLASLLKGLQQDAELAAQPVFSFTVHWRRRSRHQWGSTARSDQPEWHPRDSSYHGHISLTGVPGGRTMAFVGQCYVDEAGEEALQALWLLRDEVENPSQDWKGPPPPPRPPWLMGHTSEQGRNPPISRRQKGTLASGEA